MVVLLTFCNQFFSLTAKLDRLVQLRFAIIAAKVEKIVMPRRQVEIMQRKVSPQSHTM
jgi:ABC-type uncharacterized transport system fused permease/ATPase subunit